MIFGRRFFVFACVLGLSSTAFAASDTFSGNDPKSEKTEPIPQKTVYLTFDDGPSEITLKVLDTLKEHKAPATFFVCGNVTDFGRDAYKRILDEGHALGNHTFSHAYDKVYKSADAFEQNVARLDDLIHKFTGMRPRLLRFPGGSNNRITKGPDGRSITYDLVNRMVKQGYRHFDWNVDSRDYGANAKNADAIAKTVIEGVLKHDQAIVLMHDSYLRTASAKALPSIIAELRVKGYSFKTLSAQSFNVQFLRPTIEAPE
jgi:peptidoglycan/xylan/chitin deacetylase (PgdA/CDA1 family)